MNFKYKNLVVHQGGLNIKSLKDTKGIGIYLSEKFSFNSTVKKTKNESFECLINKAENKFRVSFLVCKYEEFYWAGIKVNFSDSKRAYFYDLIKSE